MATLRTYTFEDSVLIPLCILVSVFKWKEWKPRQWYTHSTEYSTAWQQILAQINSFPSLHGASFVQKGSVSTGCGFTAQQFSTIKDVLDLQQNSKWVWRDKKETHKYPAPLLDTLSVQEYLIIHNKVLLRDAFCCAHVIMFSIIEWFLLLDGNKVGQHK